MTVCKALVYQLSGDQMMVDQNDAYPVVSVVVRSDASNGAAHCTLVPPSVPAATL